MILGIDVGFRNFAYCIRDANSIRVVEVVDLIGEYCCRGKTMNSLTYIDIYKMTTMVVSYIFQQTDRVIRVRIEHMPSQGRRKLWMFAHLLNFHIRQIYQGIDCMLVHGKKKYQYHRELEHIQNTIENYMSCLQTYTNRKQLSVRIFVKYLESKEINYDGLGSKLDDAADAFLLTFI